MKRTFVLVAAAVIVSIHLSSAFTLDAVGYNGSELAQTPASIFLPGYGELIFEAAEDNILVVSSAYQNDNNSVGPELSFDEKDTIKITANGREPQDSDFDFVAQSAAETISIQRDAPSPQVFQVTLKGSSEGAGLKSIKPTSANIPEPTSVALGLLALCGLITRRSR
jgi:hypothetical protein